MKNLKKLVKMTTIIALIITILFSALPTSALDFMQTSKSIEVKQENKQTGGEAEDKESTSQVSKTTETSTNGLSNRAQPIIIIAERNWTSSASSYILSSTVEIPENSTGNVLKLTLPKGVTVLKEPSLDHVLIGFKADVQADGSTLITMTLVDAGNGGATLGKDIEISQSEYINSARDATYAIQAEFTNDQGDNVTSQKDYTVNIEFNKSFKKTLIVRGTNSFATIGVANTELSIGVGFDLSNGEHEGYLRLKKETFDFFKLKENSGYSLNPDGTLDIPFTKNMIGYQNKTLVVPLPLTPDLTKVKNSLFIGQNLNVYGTISFDNGRTEDFSTYYEINYFAREKRSLSNFLQLYPLIGQNGKLPRDVAEFMLGRFYNKSKAYNINDQEYVLSLYDKFEVSFTLPDYLQWYGDSSLYDASTNRVTLSVKDYLQRSSASMHMYLYVKSDLPIRIKDYNYASNQNNLSNITVDNFTFKDIRYVISIDGEIHELVINESEKISSDYFKSDFNLINPLQIEYGNNKKLMQGRKDILLATGKISVSAEKSYMHSAKEVDLSLKDETYNYGIKMLDYMRIKKVEFSKEEIKALPANLNLTFYYKTNTDSSMKKVETPYNTITLGNDEYITWFKVETGSMEGISKTITNEVFKLYGDVLEVNQVPKGDYFDLRYPVTANLLTESTTSSHHSHTLPRDSLVYLYPNKKYVHQDNVSASYYPWTNTFEAKLNFSNINFVENINEIKLDLNKDLEKVRLYGFGDIEGQGISVTSVDYKTNKNKNSTHATSIATINLADDEYFTELSMVVNVTGKNSSSISLARIPLKFRVLEKGTVESNIFNVIETDLVATSNIGFKAIYETQTSFSASTNFGFGTSIDMKNSGGINLGTKNIGESVEVPISLINRLTNSYDQFDFINPAYHISIPGDFDFESVEFKNQFHGKTPEIKTYKDEQGNVFLRIRFYGDPESVTGFKGHGVFNDVMTLHLKVNKFAKSGDRTESVLTYVDLAETFNSADALNYGFKGQYEGYKTNVANAPVLNSKTIFDPIMQTTITVGESSGINRLLYYKVLQNHEIVIDSNVNKDSDISLAKEVSIRSGETFNAYVDLYNGGGTAMDKFVMYVPVPQGSNNEWKAKLVEAGIDNSGTVDVLVSQNSNPTMNELDASKSDPTGMYESLSSVSDLSKVTMIKLKSDSIGTQQSVQLKGKFTNYDAYDGKTANKTSTNIKYAYTTVGGRKTGEQTVSATLKATNIGGRLFIDADEDGVMDTGELAVSGKTVSLYDKQDQLVDSTTSDANGNYSFVIPALLDGYYLKVEKTKGLLLTKVNNESTGISTRSYFDETNYKAIPTLANVEYLNAGFIEAPEIDILDNPYTVKVNKLVEIKYAIAVAGKAIKFESMDKSIASVHETTGIVTGVKPGKTKIRIYYATDKGTVVEAYADVTVLTNNKPVISSDKDEYVFNVGDTWDALDPTIIKGLSLSDDHDSVDYTDLKVKDDTIPVGGKFLFFFSTANTGKLTSPGTYVVTYSYEDSDGNSASKTIKIKVNGQPYMKSIGGTDELTQSTMPDFYFRVGESLDPLKDVKAYWLKASDTVGEAAKETEIVPTDSATGIFRVEKPIDNEGNPVVGDPDKAGKYQGSYYIKTPSKAESDAILELDRTLYAQGKIVFTGHNLMHPISSGVTSFANWKEFYDMYKEKLNLSAKVTTPLQDGSIETVDILDTLSVVDPVTGSSKDFSDYDFGLLDGQDSKTIELTLRVVDEGKAQWDASGPAVYGQAHKDVKIMITVQRAAVGNAPHIHANDIERVRLDEVRDATIASPDKNLISKEAMEEAKANGTRPLYNRLMNDVRFEDDEDGVILEGNKELIAITRISNPTSKAKKDYLPSSEEDIKEMLTTIGTYELVYRAKDKDHNQTYGTRIVYVSGETIFVNNMVDKTPLSKDTLLTVLQSNDPYEPTAIYAYHIDYDEVTAHETTVITEQTKINIKQPGSATVSYKTKHHFGMYPDGKTERLVDTLQQTLLIHGEITFNHEDQKVYSSWVDQPVDLTNVKASYKKGLANGGYQEVEIPVDSNQTGNNKVIRAKDASKVEVILSANASTDSDIVNHTSNITTTVEFYGIPEISISGMDFNGGPETSLDVAEVFTLEDFKKQYPASAQMKLPDGTYKDLTSSIVYDISHMQDATYPYLKLFVSYILDGQMKLDEKIINLKVIAAPVVTTSQEVYSKNVKEAFDPLQDTGLSVESEGNSIAITPSNIEVSYGKVMGQLPIDALGQLSQAGSYKVRFSYTDRVGNKGEKEILVQVNGLPEFHNIPEIEKRVGDDIDVLQQAYVTWFKAPDDEGAATQERFDYSNASATGAIFEIINMKETLTGATVDFAALNKAGYYDGDFRAVTPTGGESIENHTLLLHGKPNLEVNSTLNLSKNITKPDDFLATYRSQLGLQASVERAYKDKAVEKVDISANITIDPKELDKIQYGTIGNYPIEVSVKDSLSIDGSKNNAVTKTITVNILEINGTPPSISTPASIQRVIDDDIGIGNSGEHDVEAYLLQKASYSDAVDNPIVSKEITSIKKVKGPSSNTFTEAKNPDNDTLKALMKTVGEYEATITVTDKNQNIVAAMMKIEVAGKTEFGYDKAGSFVKLDSTLDIRQSDIEYGFDGIYARHMDPNGQYDRVGVNKPKNVDISKVSVHSLTIDAPHHYVYYDDNPAYPRGNDSFNYTLLVQGKIEFVNADEDIYTRVGSTVNPLQTVVSKDDIKDVYAQFEKIDVDGKKEKQTLVVTANSVDTSDIGIRQVTLSAIDTISKAGNNTATTTRTVYIESVPNIQVNEYFNVDKSATENDLKNGLQADITYVDSLGLKKLVPAGAIAIDYEETLKNIQTQSSGKKQPLSITVTYKDNNIEKTKTKTAYVYVLNDPSVVMEIPKSLELKDDAKEKDIVSAKSKIRLYQGEDKDSDKASVPGINIQVDKEVEMNKNGTTFKVKTFTKDGKVYDGTTSIMQLKYGVVEEDYFLLKANKADIDDKNLGVYEGTLHITMEYER